MNDDDRAAGPEPDLRACETFKVARGDFGVRAVVLSMPKAGTYLMAKVLENLGLVDLEVHLWETGLSDYRGMSNLEKVSSVRESVRDMPLRTSARMVRPGQFAVGHVSCTPESREALGQFVRILCLRDARHALTSYMRFEFRRIAADPLWHAGRRTWTEASDDVSRMRGFLAMHGEAYLSLTRNLHQWTRETGVNTCRFEDLLGDNGDGAQRRCIGAVAVDLGKSAEAGMDALADALGYPTLTFSGRRTNLEGFWDASVETLFADIGGPEVNRRLGYG